MGLSVVGTLVYAWIPAVRPWLTLRPGTIGDLRVTGVAMNTFVAAPASVVAFLIFVAIGVFLFLDRVRRLWYTRRNDLLFTGAAVLVGGWLVDTFVVPRHGWGLAVELLLFALFGTILERRWGARRLLKFSAWVLLGSNALGALLLWQWPGVVSALFGRGAALPFGNNALVDAMMSAWCLLAGRQRLAILNIEARKLVWVLVAINVLDVLLTSRLTGLMGLVAIGIAVWLLGGTWRPSLLIDRVRLWWLRRKRERQRGRFEVIPGGRDRGRTLH